MRLQFGRDQIRLRHPRRHRLCRPAATPTTAACWRCCRDIGVDRAPRRSCRGCFPDPTRKPTSTRPARLLARDCPGRPSPHRWPRLRRHAGRSHPTRSRIRSSPSCTIRCAWKPACPSRAQDELVRAGDGGARARPARHRQQPDDRARRSPPTSRCLPARSPSPSPAPIRRTRATGTGKPLQLLAVGSIVPRKAYDVLVRALAPLRGPRLAADHRRPDRPQRASTGSAAGSDPGDGTRPTASRSPVRRTGERLDTFYATADVFVHALALRRLWHGAGRGDGARAADRLHDRRRGRRDRARCRRHQGAARRRGRAARRPSAACSTIPLYVAG